jgi:hypothetical protein
MPSVVADISAPQEVDGYPVHLFGGVDYVASVFGQTIGGGSGRTLPNPAVAILDTNLNVLDGQDDSWVLGADPLFKFKVPTTGDYVLAVTDLTGGTGSYEVVFDVSQGPFQFGSPVGDFGPGAFNIGSGYVHGRRLATGAIASGVLGVQGSAEDGDLPDGRPVQELAGGDGTPVTLAGLPADDPSAGFV